LTIDGAEIVTQALNDESASIKVSAMGRIVFRVVGSSPYSATECTTQPKVSTKFSRDRNTEVMAFRTQAALAFGAAMDRKQQMRSGQPFFIVNKRRPLMSATTDKIKGRVKEAVGVVTDNQRLKDEGRTDQATGKVKKAVERVIDKAKR
jgi:uncharacterized protein YjbJ (UPF0337 family)